MSSRKAKALRASEIQKKIEATKLSETPPPAEVPNFEALSFPYAPYTGLVGIHTSLLAFTALYLPRSSLHIPTALYNAYYQISDPYDSTVLSQPKSDISGTSIIASLTTSPVQTLAWTVVGVAVLQAWWGGWVKQWALRAREDGSEGERKAQRRELEKDKDLNQAFLATGTTSVLFFATLILFGAPLTSHLAHTYLLSLLLSFLAVFPPAYTLGVPISFTWPSTSFLSLPQLDSSQSSFLLRLYWVRLFAELSPRTPLERALVYPAVGTALGCWLGAIPLALDWDRSWQAWPLPPTYGALLGYVSGSLGAMIVSAIQYFADMNRMNAQARQERKVKETNSKKKKNN
ncbi:PIG-F-domain-containing protein [Heliocybe sulcata]|uniref:PIG-F-domain-containing protein n=1 Tax=Heliocybe sulcata TaxID=5364 RepID=A0A5C3N8T6_9AGAM|nr:PIG-F-domain-containing protein [Heliocybe sulcata]